MKPEVPFPWRLGYHICQYASCWLCVFWKWESVFKIRLSRTMRCHVVPCGFGFNAHYAVSLVGFVSEANHWRSLIRSYGHQLLHWSQIAPTRCGGATHSRSSSESRCPKSVQFLPVPCNSMWCHGNSENRKARSELSFCAGLRVF